MSDRAPARIDAHQHFWDLEVRPQPWTDGLAPLERSFAPADLAPHLETRGIDGTVLVQVATEAAEAEEFLAVAAEHPWVRGVVAWVDLTRPDVGEELDRLRALPAGDRLVGVRHQVQGEPDPRWLLREDVRDGLAAVARAGLVYDLLVLSHQLPAAVEVVGLVPDLRWVLDHCGKPPVADGVLDPWREQMAALAARDQVACKLSGLVTEAAEAWTTDDLRPYADHVLSAFGPRRVMAGSDWPVCLLRTSYAGAWAVADELASGLTDAERDEVLGGTATRWYGL